MISPSEPNAPFSGELETPLAAARERADTTKAKSTASFLRQVRLWHLYLGTFFAPAILFFSLTGAAQVLNLHETQPGSTYQPPVWLEKLAQAHKKQTLVMRPKGGPPRAAGSPAGRPSGDGTRAGNDRARPAPAPTPRSTLILKWYFFFMSLGLTATTLLGIYMAFKYNRDHRVIWGMLIVGTVIPVLLLAL